MATFDVGLDDRTLAVIEKLTDGIAELIEISKLKLATQAPSMGNWYTASHFCEKYDISQSTLTRRVKGGKIARKTFDDGIIRYRLWAAGEGEGNA